MTVSQLLYLQEETGQKSTRDGTSTRLMLTTRTERQRRRQQQRRQEELCEPLLPTSNEQETTSELSTQDDVLPSPPPSSSNPRQSATTLSAPSSVPTPPISRNVSLTLIFTFCAFAGRSIWSQSVLATFVYLLADNNPEAVGFITAVMGISQLVASFPSGLVADSYRRDTMLKVASGIGVVAIITTLFVCSRHVRGGGDKHHMHYSYLVIALGIWGCFWGVANTSLSALFADSIPTGQRAKYFTQRSILTTIGNTSGPLVALTMFLFLGDKWTVTDCAVVMMAGQLICAPGMIILCMLNDDDAAVNDVTIHDETTTAEGSECNETAGENLTIEEGGVVQDNNGRYLDSSEENVNDDDEDESEDNQNHNTSYYGLPSTRVIPVFVATTDLLSGLASGMSIRYFPIFFVNNLHLSPVTVQIVYFLAPMTRAVLFYVANRLSKRFGRMRVTVAHKWIGISLMLSMICAYIAGLSTYFVCILFILRTAFMNSTSALTRSMLMDNVPKTERGKWAALESVNMFSWSGSAALGGILVGKIGILPLFGTTAIVQFIATLPIIALFQLDKLPHQPGTSN
jgi:MFS family permease